MHIDQNNAHKCMSFRGGIKRGFKRDIRRAAFGCVALRCVALVVLWCLLFAGIEGKKIGWWKLIVQFTYGFDILCTHKIRNSNFAI